MAQAVLYGLVEVGGMVAEADVWRVDPRRLAAVQSSRRAADMLTRRLELLPPPVLELLTVGALLGKSFDLERAADLCGMTLADAVIGLDAARKRHMVWTDAEGTRCRIVHDKLREALLDRLAPERRRELHLRVATDLAALDPVSAFDVAFHFDAANEPRRALPYALTAAEQARAQHALEVAEQQYRIAERGAPGAEDPSRGKVIEGLGDELMLRGRYDEAERWLLEAQGLARETLERARLCGKLGELAFKRGDLPAAAPPLERALAMLGRPVPRGIFGYLLRVVLEGLVQSMHTLFPRWFVGRRSLEGAERELLAVRLHSRLMYVYWFTQGLVPTLWCHLRGLNLAEKFPPTAELAAVYSEHSPVMTVMLWFSRGRAYATRSLAIRRERGDTWGEGQSNSFLAFSLFAGARLTEALAGFREAVRLLERTGDTWEQNTAETHTAWILHRLGHVKEAIETSRRVYQRAVDLGDRQSSGHAIDAWARASGGRVPREAIADEMRFIALDGQRGAEVRLAEAQRLLRENRPLEAVAVLEEARSVVYRTTQHSEYVATVFPWRATALRRCIEATPLEAVHRRDALLRRARWVTREALFWAWQYKNNLPHALREAGHLEALRGRPREARRRLDESLARAERQGALLEMALSRLTRGRLGKALGWSDAEADLAEARAMLVSAGVEGEPLECAAQGSSTETVAATHSLADRFASILDSGRAVASALTRDDALAATREAVLHLLRAEACTLLLCPTGLETEWSVWTGSDGVTETRVQAAAAQAVAEGGPVSVPRSDDDHADSPRSVLCAPLYVRDVAVACIYATHSQVVGLFGDEELRLAAYIATLAGAALENAHGFSDLKALHQTLEVRVQERTTELGQVNRDLEKMAGELEATNAALRDQIAVRDRMQAALVQSEKLASIGLLSSGIAHEINNPIAFVANNLFVVDRDVKGVLRVIEGYEESREALARVDPEAAARIAAIINEVDLSYVRSNLGELLRRTREGVARVTRIVGSMRSLASTDRPNKKDASLPIMAEAAFELIRGRLQKGGIEVDLDFGPDPVVYCVPTQIEQVMLNLVTNAMHAIEATGAARGRIGINMRRIGDQVLIDVSDTGSGIGSKDLPQIFDPFFTTKPVGDGMGLGLAITHTIVAGHGGRIEVQSEPGQGSRFRVFLPVAPSKETP